MKPKIGIVEWPYYDKDEDKIYEVVNEVVEKVAQNGGIPIGIFPTQVDKFQEKRISEINELTNSEKLDLQDSLNICDAIIKPGALKIYGFERYIYEYSLEKNIPYLGICAGMQLMANNGNQFIQNIRNEDKGIKHHSKEDYAHKIKILRNTLLHEILGQDEIMVNSRHNYHISSPGKNSISALSEDGIIEAIENPIARFHLGVQWHPETLNDDNTTKIFNRFIEEAKEYRKNK